MRKYCYTPQLMVPSTIEMETGNIMLGTWTRYFLSLTMLPDQIKVNWRVRPISKDPDQEAKKKSLNLLRNIKPTQSAFNPQLN